MAAALDQSRSESDPSGDQRLTSTVVTGTPGPHYCLAMGLFSRGGKTGVISETPRIEVIDDVASAEECAHVISLVEGKMRDARVVGEEKADVMMSKRSASVGWLATNQTPAVSELVSRVAGIAQMPAKNVEVIQVVKYVTGDQHTLHLDTFDPEEPGGAQQMRNGGQRLRTGLLYLAAPDLGGSTAFPNAGKARVKAQPGRLVLFDTVFPGTTTPDPDALHSGMPVVRGEKWACNFWFRERAPKAKKGQVAGGGGRNAKARKGKKRR